MEITAVTAASPTARPVAVETLAELVTAVTPVAIAIAEALVALVTAATDAAVAVELAAPAAALIDICDCCQVKKGPSVSDV